MGNNVDYKRLLDFYKDKRVLITGNTGFKGSWFTHILIKAGAEVTGYSLQPPTEPSLFKIAGLDKEKKLRQIYADVRDLSSLKDTFEAARPEIVIHMAAQPIVRDSYADPVNTYEINVMGTVNVCEAVRTSVDNKGVPYTKSFLNVTTDKVYKNNEWEWGYRETDYLDGFDPYSNSKSCSELVTHCYKNAFFTPSYGNTLTVRVSTARAGNVIGGGDFSNDRLVPDCIRTITNAIDNKVDYGEIIVRNPVSTRPFEHVLEPLFAYLMIAKEQYEDSKYAGYYNVGPEDADCVCSGDLVSLFCDTWNSTGQSPKVSWVDRGDPNAPHEANFLKLDCSKIKSAFGWKPRWGIKDAIAQTVNWTKVWLDSGDIKCEMDREIEVFVGDCH